MVLKINAFELNAGISLSFEENTAYRWSMCYKAFLRF